MPAFTRIEVYNAFLTNKLIPLFYHKDIQVAKNIIDACSQAGLSVIEYTNRGDFAYQTFSDLARNYTESKSNVILGTGSVIDAPTAALYINNGANFIVSPSFNVEIAKICNRRKVAYLPGCGTMLEIANAEEWGVEIVKLFPGETVGGPEFIKAMLGPNPWTRVMPTGISDISKEKISAWFKAGASCIGVGSKLIPNNIAATGDYGSISTQAELIMDLIVEVKN